MQAASALMLSQLVVRGFPVTIDVQDLITSLIVVFSDLNQVGDYYQSHFVFRISHQYSLHSNSIMFYVM